VRYSARSETIGSIQAARHAEITDAATARTRIIAGAVVSAKTASERLAAVSWPRPMSERRIDALLVRNLLVSFKIAWKFVEEEKPVQNELMLPAEVHQPRRIFASRPSKLFKAKVWMFSPQLLHHPVEALVETRRRPVVGETTDHDLVKRCLCPAHPEWLVSGWHGSPVPPTTPA
jgi:hypothetical protein